VTKEDYYPINHLKNRVNIFSIKSKSNIIILRPHYNIFLFPWVGYCPIAFSPRTEKPPLFNVGFFPEPFEV
jgi:hypothetical protein